MEIFRNLNQKIIENIENGIIVIDDRGAVMAVNPPFTRFTGRKAEDLLGKSYFHKKEPFHPLETRISPLLKATLEEGMEVHDVEWEISPGWGSAFSFVFSARRVNAGEGKPPWVLGIIRDVTGERELEKSLVQTQKSSMVSQLAAGAAHEIRNPLTSLRGFLQLLQRDFSGTAKEEHLKIMIGEIDRINRIIQDFMVLVRPASPKLQPCSVREMVREIVMLVESEARLRKIRLVTDALPESLWAFADYEQIKQVLLNLVKNSLEAMPEGGDIVLRITPAGYKINIIIIDQGIGMDPQTLNKAECPFFTTKAAGTGLGLAISREIINNHGGKLVIRSKPRKGTKVLVQLPAADLAEAFPPPDGKAGAPGPVRHPGCLESCG